MHIKVDTALCERSGICTELAPDTFRLEEEEGLVVTQDAPGSDVEDVRFAAENCPRLALSVQD
jgi:ferredoxin